MKFIRRRGMLALPEPVPGGNVEELRSLVNLPDDDGWILFVAWLLAALRPGRPFPLLAVNGEQGSAKSTLCRMGRRLIDPNTADLRRPPRDERDLMIAANNGWIVALDNLSGLAPTLSDALCTLATGGGFATRELYTDGDEKLFDATRPIILNGIEDVATRPDLLDRALCLTLPEIHNDNRRDEDELWSVFTAVRPRVLGALLAAVAAGLRELPSTRLASKPRMADFALWVVAAETALPWGPGAFLNAYAGNRGAANELAIEASIVAAPLAALLTAEDGRWEGPARELLDALESHAAENVKKHRDWPAGAGAARKLGGELRRLAPNLRRAGTMVIFDREPGGKRRRLIRLENTCETPSRPSRPCQSPENAGETPGRSRDGQNDGAMPTVPDRPAEYTVNSGVRDGRDGRDGLSPRFCVGGSRMDGLTLLRKAWAAGLAVQADGERLRIRGPRQAEPIAQQLIAHKAAVLSALTAKPALTPDAPSARTFGIRVEDLNPDWRVEWEERAAVMEYDGELPRQARRGPGAGRSRPGDGTGRRFSPRRYLTFWQVDG